MTIRGLMAKMGMDVSAVPTHPTFKETPVTAMPEPMGEFLDRIQDTTRHPDHQLDFWEGATRDAINLDERYVARIRPKHVLDLILELRSRRALDPQEEPTEDTPALPHDPRIQALNEARDPLSLEDLRLLASDLEADAPGTWDVVECLPAQPGKWAVATNTRPHPEGFSWEEYDSLVTGWQGSYRLTVWQAATAPSRVKALISWADAMGRTMNAMRMKHAREKATLEARIRQLEQKLEARRG